MRAVMEAKNSEASGLKRRLDEAQEALERKDRQLQVCGCVCLCLCVCVCEHGSPWFGIRCWAVA
jgi:hypothetical protein